jgi:DNA replication and repair protein RecF
MHVSSLGLRNFRSYDDVTLKFSPGVSIFVGPNGMGKTNIVEAIGYLTNLESHRVSGVTPLIQAGETSASISATIEHEVRSIDVSISLQNEGKNTATINGSPVKRTREILGIVFSVIFAPEDLELVKGDPSARRKFLDEAIANLTPSYLSYKTDYERVLKQRNALLKTLNSRASADNLETLSTWSEMLAEAGEHLMKQRAAYVEKIRGITRDIYDELSNNRGPFDIQYEPNVSFQKDTDIKALLTGKMQENQKQEIERGTSLFGPHRDELGLYLDELPMRGYASQGESWSAALSLKMSHYTLLKSSLNVGDPILILDDVFSELDEIRRNKLVELVKGNEQTLITAAVIADVPNELTGSVYRVEKGKVQHDE